MKPFDNSYYQLGVDTEVVETGWGLKYGIFPFRRRRTYRPTRQQRRKYLKEMEIFLQQKGSLYQTRSGLENALEQHMETLGHAEYRVGWTWIVYLIVQVAMWWLDRRKQEQ